MELWQHSLNSSVTCPDQLAARFGVDAAPLAAAAGRYPMRITPHFLGLIRHPGDPIWRQCVPDPLELADAAGMVDPLNEEKLSPVPGLVHRYPDRVLLLVSGACAVYCRFCTRKRQVGCASMRRSRADLAAALDYIAGNRQVRDVILSGGDPLLLTDPELGDLLEGLRRIPHVEIIRLGSRVPVTLPERITEDLCTLLRGFHPVYLNTHFNHPREITPQSTEACRRLADAGIALGNQTVLLRGVNDEAPVMAELVKGLLKIRVRPYYLHHMDLVRGGGHFRTRVEKGIEIIRELRGPVSGLAVPQYVIDLPGGKGKVPILPGYVEQLGERVVLRTPAGERIEYPNAVPE